jgi:hypothetical protein
MLIFSVSFQFSYMSEVPKNMTLVRVPFDHYISVCGDAMVPGSIYRVCAMDTGRGRPWTPLFFKNRSRGVDVGRGEVHARMDAKVCLHDGRDGVSFLLGGGVTQKEGQGAHTRPRRRPGRGP